MNWDKINKYNLQQMASGALMMEQFTIAVMQLQKCIGVEPDGMIGPETRIALARARVAGHVNEVRIAYMMQFAELQAGKPYKFGAEVQMDDPDPPAWDCSELVQWAAHNAGLSMPDGSWHQVTACRDAGTLIDVDTAAGVRGALLFNFGDGNPFSGTRPNTAHVAISLGNGMTIEARSARYGVGSWPIDGRQWTHAGLVPR